MRLAQTLFLYFIIGCSLQGQGYFSAEGRTLELGSITKTYSYAYFFPFQDSLHVTLRDSTVRYESANGRVVKEIYHNVYSKRTRIGLLYLNVAGKDSISRYFEEEKLTTISESKYDSLDRLVYHATLQMEVDDLEDWERNDFRRVYTYRDSLYKNKRFLIMHEFQVDSDGVKLLSMISLFEYNRKGQMIKEIRHSPPDDGSFKEVLFYRYGKNGKLSRKTGYQIFLGQKFKHGVFPKKINHCQIKQEIVNHKLSYEELTKVVGVFIRKKEREQKYKNCSPLEGLFVGGKYRSSIKVFGYPTDCGTPPGVVVEIKIQE